MVQIAAVVPEYVCLLSNVADNHINVAVIVDVTKGGAASSPGLLKYLASAHFFEMAGLVMNQERRLQISQVASGLLDRIHDMRLGNEKILPAVVVIIEKTRTPARKRQARSAQTRAVRHVPECAGSVVVEQHVALVGKLRHHNVRQAVIIEVAEVRAHARKGLPVLVVAHSGQQSHFRESAIPVVVVQEALHRVIGHKDIGETVAVVIGKTHSQALAVRIRYTGFGGDIGERAVAIVVIEDVRHAVVIVGMTVGAETGSLLSAIAIRLKGPVHISSNQQIEFAVIVVIEESSACAPSSRAHTRPLGDIGKRPIAIVVVERVAPIAGYVNVFEAVVVIVAYRDPHAVVILRHSGQTGLLGDVGEGAIRILVI